MTEQLPLPLKLVSELPQLSQFDFSANPVLQQILLERMAGTAGSPLLIVGGTGTGKSHLLSGTAQAMLDAGQAVRLLPLRKLQQSAPELLGLEHADGAWLLDDLDAIVGNPDWEAALFALYNRQHDARRPLLMSSRELPATQSWQLRDLRSRLQQSTCLELKSLGEPARLEVLRQRAAERGLDLPEHLLDWLQVNYSRDLARLLALLKDLDHLSLVRGRRLTIPLVREWLQTVGI